MENSNLVAFSCRVPECVLRAIVSMTTKTNGLPSQYDR